MRTWMQLHCKRRQKGCRLLQASAKILQTSAKARLQTLLRAQSSIQEPQQRTQEALARDYQAIQVPNPHDLVLCDSVNPNQPTAWALFCHKELPEVTLGVGGKFNLKVLSSQWHSMCGAVRLLSLELECAKGIYHV